jgi:hypothetical protein
MPRLTLSTDSSGEVQVSKSKRRFRVHSAVFHVDDVTLKRQEKDGKIRASEKQKPHKKRAIQRARDLKYCDIGRGKEAKIDMWPEFKSSLLSSRQATPFYILRTSGQMVIDNNVEWKLVRRWAETKEVVLRGTLYAGLKKQDGDITVIREREGKPIYRLADCPFKDLTDDFMNMFDEEGYYEVIL